MGEGGGGGGVDGKHLRKRSTTRTCIPTLRTAQLLKSDTRNPPDAGPSMKPTLAVDDV
jgi:hypothetical protein